MRLVIYGRILSVGPTRPCGANTAFAFPTPVQANTACLRTGAYCPSAPSGRAGQYGLRKCSGAGQYGLSSYGRILSVGHTWPCGANTAFAFPMPVQANTACYRTGAYCPSAPSGRAGPIRPSQVLRRRPIRLVIIRAHIVRRPHVAMRGQYGFRSCAGPVGPSEWLLLGPIGLQRRCRPIRLAVARAHIARRPPVAVRGQYGPRKCAGPLGPSARRLWCRPIRLVILRAHIVRRP